MLRRQRPAGKNNPESSLPPSRIVLCELFISSHEDVILPAWCSCEVKQNISTKS